MSAVRERLTHLVDLAGRDTAEDRRLLVNELCRLLLDWPEDYPLAMRVPFEQLLEKTVQDVDAATRATLAARFAALPDAPVALLNELFFDAPEAVKNAILRRNALANDDAPLSDCDRGECEATLIATARGNSNGAFATEFAKFLHIECTIARRILSEPSGEALAAACKGVHLNRATFSALALIFAPAEEREKERRLDAYDSVPQEGAENLVRFWRSHVHAAEERTEAA